MPELLKLPLSRQNILFTIALLLLVATVTLSYSNIQRFITLSERAEQSNNLQLELSGLASQLKDVETGARGYALTGDVGYLEPYESGRKEVGQSFGRLQALMLGNQRKLERLKQLKTLSDERLAVARQLAHDVSSDASSGVERKTLDRGKAIMEQIRGQIANMMDAEQTLSRTDAEAVRRQVSLVVLVMFGSAGLSFAILVLLFVLRSRDLGRCFELENALLRLNSELGDQVQVRTGELRQSEAKLRSFLAASPDAMIIVDGAGHIYFASDRVETVFGRAPEDLIGKPINILLPERSRDVHNEHLSHYFREPRPRSMGDGLTLRALHEDGREFPVEVSLSPDKSENNLFVIATVRDVSARVATEMQLRQVQKMDAIGQITGGIAHDFNNLLAIIIGNVDLLSGKIDDIPGASELADEALDAAERGAGLVQQLLAFARQQHLDPVLIDLNVRLTDVSALLQRTLGAHIRTKIVPGEGLWSALVDPGQVDDALINLAINARDAMPDGGYLVIETANATLDKGYAAQNVGVVPGDYVMLSVSDSGTGMTPEIIAQAFEPFFTTKETGQGSGLGLSQIYGWIKQSGGHIKIYSELGHGTTIKLYLPNARQAATGVATSPETTADLPTGQETIFVVEDDPQVRAIVLRQLDELGYAVIEAEDGPAALRMVEADVQFDLLFTDIVMPGGMTGHDLVHAVKAIRPNVKVIVSTGYTAQAVRNGNGNGNGNGHKMILSKPYRKQQLAHMVRAILDADD